MEASALARRAPLGTLKPGRVSPMRAVPEHIERPEYMFHDGPERVTASEIKSPETIAKIREAGRIAAGAIEASGLDYTVLRPAWLTDEDEVDYELTTRDQPFKGTVVSRRSVAALIVRLIASPELHVGDSLGVNKPGSDGDKPFFM